MVLQPPAKNQGKRSANKFWPCDLHNQWAVQLHQAIIKVLAEFMGKNASYDIITTC